MQYNEYMYSSKCCCYTQLVIGQTEIACVYVVLQLDCVAIYVTKEISSLIDTFHAACQKQDNYIVRNYLILIISRKCDQV